MESKSILKVLDWNNDVLFLFIFTLNKLQIWLANTMLFHEDADERVKSEKRSKVLQQINEEIN